MNNWFLNERATALERVGRWDEAVAQLTAASRLSENNGGNVSQVINLGGLYCDLGRPNDALAAIGGVGANISPWGAMEKEGVRFDAAVQMGDSKQAERSLQYLREHREDALPAYQDALIIANRLDEAAQILVDRLLDPDQRVAALASVQSYAQAPSTPRVEDLRARRKAMIARREVQAAILKVGRVEKFNLEAEYSE
jgi:tetratricopeptide (TPR) repeat protein